MSPKFTAPILWIALPLLAFGGNLSGPGTAAASSASPQTAGYVSHMFQSLLHRSPTGPELSAAESELSTGRVAVAITVETSAEFRSDEISAFYMQFLHRKPSAAQRSHYLAVLDAGATRENLKSLILGSAIYFSSVAHSSNDQFARAMVVDVLNHKPGSSLKKHLLAELRQGKSRAAVAAEICSSAAARTRDISTFYKNYLGRVPTPNELTGWLTVLSAGAGDEQVIADLIGSDEYEARAMNTYVAALYRALLNRTPGGSEASAYVSQLMAGATPTQIAQGITTSQEYRADLVSGWFSAYLGRSPSPQDSSPFVTELNEGVTDQQVVAQILGSGEFYTKAGATPTSWVDSVYNTLLNRAPSAQEESAWDQAIQNSSRYDVALQIDSSAERYSLLIKGWFSTYLKRSPSNTELTQWLDLLQTYPLELVRSVIVGSDEYVNGQ